jgi:hypothetical protein
MYSISTQAAHKAYRKALGDLQIALNGEPLVAHGRGRRMYLQELQRRLDALTSASDLTYLRAELGYWERRAKRMRNRLETLYGNLPRLEADAERERHLDVAA